MFFGLAFHNKGWPMLSAKLDFQHKIFVRIAIRSVLGNDEVINQGDLEQEVALFDLAGNI